MQGIVEGPFYPALYVIVGKWLPKEEKGNLFNLIFVGTPVGSFLCPFVSGILAEQLGWEYPFYVIGVLGIAWFVLWEAIQ